MDKVVTKEQLRELILAENFRPSDLFSVDALIEDEAVKGHVAVQIKDAQGAKSGEYYHRKRTEEAFDKARKDFEGKLAEKDKELNGIRLEAAKGKVKTLFEAEKATRKLTDKLAVFIEGRLTKFSPTKAEEVEKEFKSYLDSEVDEFDKVKKLLGIEEKGEGGGIGTGKVKPAGAEPHAGDKKSADSPYLDPAKNPFIKAA